MSSYVGSEQRLIDIIKHLVIVERKTKQPFTDLVECDRLIVVKEQDGIRLVKEPYFCENIDFLPSH